jgi:hypothetical protein
MRINGTIENEPANKMPFTVMKLKPDSDKFFHAPIHAVLAVFP